MALTNLGTTTWAQNRPERWSTTSDGLDVLTVPMDGPETGRATYQSTLSRWSASSIDSRMYLAGWHGNEDRQYPRIDLRYIGCKGGSIPPPLLEQKTTLQTASATDGQLQLEVLYRSPQTVFTWIGTDPDTITHQGFSHPQDTSIVTRRMNGHVPLPWAISNILAAASFAANNDDAGAAKLALVESYLAQNQALIDDLKDRVIAYFNIVFMETTLLTEFTASPLVPDRYWTCKSVTSKILEAP